MLVFVARQLKIFSFVQSAYLLCEIRLLLCSRDTRSTANPYVNGSSSIRQGAPLRTLILASSCSMATASEFVSFLRSTMGIKHFNDTMMQLSILRYEAMWNEHVYESISAFLYGMNSKRIDWTSLQQTLMIDYQEDPIAVGIQVLAASS